MRKIMLEKAKELGVVIENPKAPIYQLEQAIKKAFMEYYFAEFGGEIIEKAEEARELNKYVYCTVANHNPDKTSLTAERITVANDNNVWVSDVPLHSGSLAVWLPRAIVEHLKTRKFIRRIDHGVDQSLQDGRKFVSSLRNTPENVLVNEYTIQELTPTAEIIAEVKSALAKAQGGKAI